MSAILLVAHNALTEFCELGVMPGTKGLDLTGRWEKVVPCDSIATMLSLLALHKVVCKLSNALKGSLVCR